MDSKPMALVLVTLGVSWSMALAGVKLHVLRLRFTPRRCPSCGRTRRDCSCTR